MRILVLGGSGWIGSRAVPLLAERHEVASPGSAETDVADAASVAAALDRYRPDAVLQLAARNPPATAEELDRANRVGAGVVAAACAARGLRLVHMSTDLVLDGRSAPYADGAAPRPVNPYGRSKAAGEAEVAAACPGALVVRTSLVVDRDTPDRFTASALARLARGESVGLFTDEVRGAIDRTTLCEALRELLAEDGPRSLAGPLNVACPRPVTRFRLGEWLLRRFGAETGPRADGTPRLLHVLAASNPERPLDVTLDVRRAAAALRTDLAARADWT